MLPHQAASVLLKLMERNRRFSLKVCCRLLATSPRFPLQWETDQQIHGCTGIVPCSNVEQEESPVAHNDTAITFDHSYLGIVNNHSQINNIFFRSTLPLFLPIIVPDNYTLKNGFSVTSVFSPASPDFLAWSTLAP